MGPWTPNQDVLVTTITWADIHGVMIVYVLVTLAIGAIAAFAFALWLRRIRGDIAETLALGNRVLLEFGHQQALVTEALKATSYAIGAHAGHTAGQEAMQRLQNAVHQYEEAGQ